MGKQRRLRNNYFPKSQNQKMIRNINNFPRCTKLIVTDLDKVSQDTVNATLKKNIGTEIGA